MRFFALLTLLSLPTLAAETRWGLRWRAPETCISAAELSAQVQDRLGRPVFALNPDYRVDGVLEAGTSPRWKARLTVVSAAGDVMGTREVEGDEEDCRALDARLAFIVAMSVEARVEAPPAPAAQVTPPPVAPPAARVPGTLWVELESDDPESTLFREEVLFSGQVNAERSLISTTRTQCKAPCARFVETPASDYFFVSGANITPSLPFVLLPETEGMKLKVKSGNFVIHTLGIVLSALSVMALGFGIPLAIVGGQEGGQQSVQNLGLGLIIGSAVGMGGAVTMISFGSTRVEFFPMPAPRSTTLF